MAAHTGGKSKSCDDYYFRVKYKDTKILVHQNYMNITFAQNSVRHDKEDVKHRQVLY